MSSFFTKIFLILTILGLSACGGAVSNLRKVVGTDANAPDEFMIKTNDPLIVSENRELVLPEQFTKKDNYNKARYIVSGQKQPDKIITASAPSKSENELLNVLNAKTSNKAEIYKALSDIKKADKQKNSYLTESILSWQRKWGTPSTVIDAKKYSECLEKVKAQGKPITSCNEYITTK